jgi:membrane-bound serine protease (ClpP class)
MLIGIGLAVLEIFFVSHGVLSFLALAAVVTSIVLGFMHSQPLGIAMLVTGVVGIPGAVAGALYWWPRTSIGRRVLLQPKRGEEVMPDNPELRDLQNLLGRVGKAKSQLLPAGPVIIDGRTIDAVSEGLPIEPGQLVRVIEVHGTWVTVRAVDDETVWEDTPANVDPHPTPEELPPEALR